MKRNHTITVLIALVFALAIAVAPLFAQGYGRENAPQKAGESVPAGGLGPVGVGMYNPGFTGSIEMVINDIKPGTLGKGEKEGILLMLEEEKLARDVYVTLGETWNIPVFANIARSEQTHMDAMAMLAERYSIKNPIQNKTTSNRGSYRNTELQKLYADLIERGLSSYEEALKVGALIEELDIADLQRLISESENKDVKVVYQNLLKGSRNHLRAFTRQLTRSGADYSPEYITDDEYQRILYSRNEAGVINDPDFRF